MTIDHRRHHAPTRTERGHLAALTAAPMVGPDLMASTLPLAGLTRPSAATRAGTRSNPGERHVAGSRPIGHSRHGPRAGPRARGAPLGARAGPRREPPSARNGRFPTIVTRLEHGRASAHGSAVAVPWACPDTTAPRSLSGSGRSAYRPAPELPVHAAATGPSGLGHPTHPPMVGPSMSTHAWL